MNERRGTTSRTAIEPRSCRNRTTRRPAPAIGCGPSGIHGTPVSKMGHGAATDDRVRERGDPRPHAAGQPGRHPRRGPPGRRPARRALSACGGPPLDRDSRHGRPLPHRSGHRPALRTSWPGSEPRTWTGSCDPRTSSVADPRAVGRSLSDDHLRSHFTAMSRAIPPMTTAVLRGRLRFSSSGSSSAARSSASTRRSTQASGVGHWPVSRRARSVTPVSVRGIGSSTGGRTAST